MSYSAPISRTSPTCIIFAVDHSTSMNDPIAGSEVQKRKAEGVADAGNRVIQNLVIKCARDTGVHDYFHIGLVGYGGSTGPAWGGALSGRDLVPISEIADNPLRIEERNKKVDDGAGGLLEQKVKFPIWIDPVANGGTPMCQGLNHAVKLLEKWVSDHPEGYPPILFNITDGESTDGDPTAVADAIKSVKTNDGAVLLFNLHLSATDALPITFPASDGGLPDQYAKLLFQMSSIMPGQMRSQAAADGFAVAEGSRGYVFNADLISLAQFLDIGTRPSNLR